jgi:hypothetical protein
VKYAIYKNKIGLRAVEYADTKEAIKDLPYIKESYLPVIINNMGGYTSFNMDYEKEYGFIEIIEVEEDKEPLTREQRYPKNSPEFEYGWISPDGDTYNTGHEGHSRAADTICEELGFNSYHGERELEEKGWIKVTASHNNGVLEKAVYVKDLYITKKQADILFIMNLWDDRYVRSMIRRSENSW